MKDFSKEIKITASRSSGPGGQNVNKVNTKVEIRLNIAGSLILSDEEKLILLNKLANKINANAELIITSQSERTQLANKEVAIHKLNRLISNALKVKKKRRPTKVPKAAKEKRLQTKHIVSEKKENRKKPK